MNLSELDIFQVWIESPNQPDEKTLNWMRSVINGRPEGSSYTLIAPRNYFEGELDIIFLPLDGVIKKNLDSSIVINEIWPRLSVRQKSEVIRTRLASNIGALVYLDCDMESVHWNISLPENGRPLFLKTSSGRIDNNAFFVNGDTEFFSDFLGELVTSMRSVLKRNERLRYSHTYSLINSKIKDVEVLDSNFVIHRNRG